ncbi:MAG: hypothetical protein RL211_860 [Pseudomonadota bacterium]|jgi:hypothetical protein
MRNLPGLLDTLSPQGTLGWDVVREPALWWRVAALPLIGALNLGRIRQAIWCRMVEQPLGLLWPTRSAVATTAPAKEE